jgi:uncharacterized protein
MGAIARHPGTKTADRQHCPVSSRILELDRSLRGLGEADLTQLARLLLAERLRASRPPLRKLELVVTEDCNLRCDYCWVPKRSEYIQWPVARAALDYLFLESRDAAKLQITLFGGEPLLAWDVIAKTVEYGRAKAARLNKRIGWAITTNGTLLNEDMIRFGHAHGFNYLLSIDGTRMRHDSHRRFADGTGSFDRAVSALPALKRRMKWVGARMTVNPDTCEGLARDVKQLARHGINQFLIGTNPDAKWTAERVRCLEQEWERILDVYVSLRSRGWPIRMTCFESCDEKKAKGIWGCEAGRDKIAVTPSGDIYACSRFVAEPPLRTRGWLGTLEQGIIAEENVRHITDGRDEIRYRCRTCGLRDGCSGGCPATNLSSTGSLYVSPMVDCRMNRFWQRLKRVRPEAWEVHRTRTLGAGASSPGTAGVTGRPDSGPAKTSASLRRTGLAPVTE